MSSTITDPASGLPGGLRSDLVLIPIAASAFGFVSGLLTSSRLAARQFLAENAHRLPTTVQGWYFYQKTKNYRVMYSGVLGGLKTGGRIGLWTATFVGLEEGIEAGVRRSLPDSAASYRTRWASGGLAGLGLATTAGQIYRLSRYAAPRRMFLGASLGIIAGGSHDLRDWMKTKLPVALD
ncbi:hypothetical protein BCR35DRAFT_277936 [Leucosporidium creatinivorum]|uniref:Tim17/Tim22/Tim23/Pmp24 family-domain-containing protein n=1 Tax=Leucosporidium creatinivorum TaxID=106004 RepID=A0A1Y2FN95_9BASI|nr:hypothetical protein BCR35DRAFT_277936 [Leucosporidium creatinivorum]